MIPHALAPTTGPAPAAFRSLTPDDVLQALDAVGLHGDGRLLQLNSYENRVFQVMLEDGSAVVAKFYRPGRWTDSQILEEHHFARQLQDAEVPVVAPLVLQDDDRVAELLLVGNPPTLARVPISLGMDGLGADGLGAEDADDERLAGRGPDAPPHRLSVSPRYAGRAPELEDPATLRWLGRFLARLHAVGRREPFAHRRRLDPQTLGHQTQQRLLAMNVITPAEAPGWTDACRRALELIDTAWQSVDGLRLQRLHGDCHPGNILWREEGPHIVDLDDAGTGPAVQDLWMLLSGDPSEAQTQLDALLEGYESLLDFDRRELRLIEPLRTLRMIHYSAWLAERWADPAFPAAFPWFGTPAYWSQQTTQLREQIEKMV